jgi:lipopolysaccharide/colanic/teichoic acid biosynthesis glycosyltransferase
MPSTAATGRLAARIAKRGIDLAGAIVGLVVLSPVLAWIALVLVLTQGRPVLFRQVRPGRDGKPFTMVKFRTMRPTRPGEVYYLTDEERMTRLGRFLRSSSLDELPELWNVLRGEMSLVGPRPLLMEYLDQYSKVEARRHEVRPGITGWAVVNGRNLVEFDDRLQLDVWYVDHWSLALDLRILAMTVSQVLRREGVSATEDLGLGFRLPGWDQPGDPASSERNGRGPASEDSGTDA